MLFEAEVKWAKIDEEGFEVLPEFLASLQKAKVLWTEIKTRGDAAHEEACALVSASTCAYLTMENLSDDETMEAWFDGEHYEEFDIDDQVEGTDVTVSAVSFAESDNQADMGDNCEFVPTIRASCRFELPISKTKAELEAINANYDLEPLHWLINFEIAGVWLGHADSISLRAQAGEEWIELRG